MTTTEQEIAQLQRIARAAAQQARIAQLQRIARAAAAEARIAELQLIARENERVEEALTAA